ncbi:mitochondrial solute carrier family 25 member 33/36 [Andalucia godoyi]|uniref:Mitochondrial solute carrier family 25 member 33/36 n=1 Tax=Andalucia godoyi TaxID=505711 RepID=A0A8K0AK63_ANDGO|nr:mitochondrial solute carrier family 25 member 33/36 [Andalucia godoyi]|eukprot:ANDGO_02416.mRNA.1 mitochondrial solute carrier family 25 member 33/36
MADSVEVELQKVPTASQHGVAGAIAGVISSVLTFPTDTVRARLQVFGSGSMKYKGGTISIIRGIMNEEGSRALFRGLTPTLCALAPSMCIFFSTYEYFKGVTNSHALSACSSWMIMSTATNPLWVAKLRLQTKPAEYARLRMVGTLKHVYRSEGAAGLFSGLRASWFGASTVTIQMSLYEKLKASTTLPIPVSSALSMAVASIMTYPYEVVRSRLQVGVDPSIMGACRSIMNSEAGWRGFYAGLRTSMLRLTLASGITFTLYESILKTLSQADTDSQRL